MASVVVTGASGLLGTNLCFALVDAGHDVTALYRSAPTLAHLQADARGKHIRFVKGDLDDEAVLAAAFAGKDAVFHVAAAVSILSTPTPALVRANVDGTTHVISAVRKAGVSRLVHTSSIVCIGIANAAAGSPDADETSAWNLHEARVNDGYAITKKQSEELVQAAADVDAVIVNPGYLFGPYDSRPSSGRFIVDLVKGKFPGTSPGVNSFVDVRDVARGMISAWQRGRRGERYILAGHNLHYLEIMNLIASRAGITAPQRVLPRFLASLAGSFGDLQFRLTGNEPLLTSASVNWAYCDRFRVSSQKAQRELGYVISPLEGAIDDALAWFRAHGQLP